MAADPPKITDMTSDVQRAAWNAGYDWGQRDAESEGEFEREQADEKLDDVRHYAIGLERLLNMRRPDGTYDVTRVREVMAQVAEFTVHDSGPGEVRYEPVPGAGMAVKLAADGDANWLAQHLVSIATDPSHRSMTVGQRAAIVEAAKRLTVRRDASRWNTGPGSVDLPQVPGAGYGFTVTDSGPFIAQLPEGAIQAVPAGEVPADQAVEFRQVTLDENGDMRWSPMPTWAELTADYRRARNAAPEDEEET